MRNRTQAAVLLAVLAVMAVSGLALRALAPARDDIPNPSALTPAQRREILAAREAVWRAWFSNNQAKLREAIGEEIIAINPGEVPWQDRHAVLADARSFAQDGGRLLRLEFPHTDIQLYGDIAVLYTRYLYEYEAGNPPKRETISGRGTEIFVRRDGRWVNTGWHLDSGR